VVHEPELLLGASEQGIRGGANARVVGLSSPDDSTKQRPAEKGSGERGERLVGGEEEHRRRLKLRPPSAFAREAAREDGRRRANATHHSTELPGSRLAALGWIWDHALRLALPTLARPRQLLFQGLGCLVLELLRVERDSQFQPGLIHERSIRLFRRGLLGAATLARAAIAGIPPFA